MNQLTNPSDKSYLSSSNNQHNQLQISGLDKTYANGVKALDGISLELSNGMFGLLGPNGAGKSSFMRSVATLQSIDSGSIIFNGENVQNNPESLRQSLGYLPQEFGVYPKVSAFQLLDYIAVLKGVLNKQQRHHQIATLLKQTNLYQHKDKAVANYSGGMRQRFGIAQALLGDPKVLIIDEPTAGLDPQERNSFHNLLCGISERMIVILSTHIVEDIKNLCPQMAILDAGKICFHGNPNQLIAGLKNKVWIKTTNAKELESIKQQHEVLSIRLSCGHYQVRVVSDSPPGDAFELTEADLEDAYFYCLNQNKLKRQQSASIKHEVTNNA